MTNGTYSNTVYLEPYFIWVDETNLFLVHPERDISREYPFESSSESFKNECRPPPN